MREISLDIFDRSEPILKEKFDLIEQYLTLVYSLKLYYVQIHKKKGQLVASNVLYLGYDLEKAGKAFDKAKAKLTKYEGKAKLALDRIRNEAYENALGIELNSRIRTLQHGSYV